MFQQTTIIGNLGADPVMRYSPSGVPVTNFDVATSRKWTDGNGQQQEKTTWFRVAAWRKQAEVCAQYLTKGSKVLVIGEVEARAYATKEGEARAALEITASTIKFLSSKSAEDSPTPASSPNITDEEIPF